MLTEQLRRVADDPSFVSELRARSLARRADLGWDRAADLLTTCYRQAIEIAEGAGGSGAGR